MATATLDWSQCPAVESIPGKRSGAWVFKGTRMPVSSVFENLQDMSVDELVEEFCSRASRFKPSCNLLRKPRKRPHPAADAVGASSLPQQPHAHRHGSHRNGHPRLS